MRRQLIGFALAGAFTSCAAPTPESSQAPIAIEHVTVIPMDRPGVLEDHTIVTRGDRIVTVAPAASVPVPATALRIDGRGKFVVPGLADMHAHAIEPPDLEMYVAAGVTQLRILAANQTAIALRDEAVGGNVLRPSVYVEGFLTDGNPPIQPFALIAKDAAGVGALVALHQELRLPSIKTYSRLSRASYDALVAQGRAAGLAIVGHVPFDVGLEHALASGQRAIEHLSGYDPWFNSEARMADIAARTRAAGTWNVPTLVLRSRGATAKDRASIDRIPGIQYVHPDLVSSWRANVPDSDARDSARARGLQARSAMVRALDRAGARLLVGTDTGNPFVVPGYSVADEIAMFVEAGVSPWAALSAATNGAAEFLGLGDEMGSIAPGRRADLLLLAGNPLDDVTNLRRREGVVLRGLWHPTAVLEGRLARRSAGYVAAKSRFDGIPAPAVDGTTEFAARFEMRNGGSRVNEQRLTIVRSADGERIALGELIEGDMTGVTSVRVRLERGGRSYREEHPGGILMGLLGVIDATRDADELRVTVRPAFGAVVNRTFAVPASAILGSATIATDVLVHDRLGKMRVGEQVELSIVALMPSLEPSIDRWRLLARRTADGPRRVLNRDTIVRNFEITLVLASERVRGSLALDADSHLVEQRLGSQHTVRIE